MAEAFNAECIPWGENRGMDLPGTARLRYLVDDKMANMAFRLPVAHAGEGSGSTNEPELIARQD